MTLAIIFLLLVTIPLGLAQRSRKQTARVHLAEALDLSFVPPGLGDHPVLRGRRGDVGVAVAYLTRGTGKNQSLWTRITATGVAPGVLCEPEGLKTGLRKVFEGADYACGDPESDALVHLRGEPALLAAMLDAETRTAMRTALVLRGASVRDGAVVVERRSHIDDSELLRALVDETADLARRLQPLSRSAIAERLGVNILTDPEAGVRLACLAALEHGQDKPATAAAAEGARNDPDPLVRLRAARILGDPTPFRTAPRDILHLYAPHDPDGLARLLLKAGARVVLADLLDVAVPAVRVAALHALARIGTPEEVEAIAPLGKGIFGDDAVRTAAREAIASIQARVGHDAAGRVALTGTADTAGAVSIAADAGRVSIARGREKA